MSNINWSVTTTKGFTYIEGLNFLEKPGMRKPWVQLVNHLEATGDSIEQLTLFTEKDRVVIGIGEEKPLSYGLQYILEADDLFGARDEHHYVDVVLEYEDRITHLIFDDSDMSLVLTREGTDKAMIHTTVV